MEDNREYEINILQSYLRRIFACPWEIWKIPPLRLKMVVKGVEIKCKKQEENYLLRDNVVEWQENYFHSKLKKFLIHNGTSTLEQNTEIQHIEN